MIVARESMEGELSYLERERDGVQVRRDVRSESEDAGAKGTH